MKFHIGQPVWSIGHCDGWSPAVVSGVFDGNICQCATCGEIVAGTLVYAIQRLDKEPPLGWDHWGARERNLRPRDPDQFLHADPRF